MDSIEAPTTWTTSFMRGCRRKCPRCGEGAMFRGYLSIADHCSACKLPFEPLRADDAPAYFTIAIVGHIVVSGLLMLESYAHPPTWVQLAIWLPSTAIMSLAMLPYLKGAVMAAIYCSNKDA
ncbi:DUF983 domain-containing protein [Dongia sp.]|jgi:uncharacterized protein (DUF983 family)|uniref:DUF983 domain-containing protein n=1 Tax=Dongia sp. TaxID=1977262 RepID=UPI0035B0BE59